MFEVQTSQNVQQCKWLLHFAALNETLLQQVFNSHQTNIERQKPAIHCALL